MGFIVCCASWIENRWSGLNVLGEGTPLLAPGCILGPGALEPLDVRWVSKPTPLFWLGFGVSQMRLHLQGGQNIFLKRKVVLEVTHL